MTVTGVDTLSSPLALSASVQPRKDVADVKASQADSGTTQNQAASRSASGVQDQVTLSREAQALSVSDSQSSKNNTFQQSPSPFDK